MNGEVSMNIPFNTHLNSSYNAATVYGGGIYHEDNAASVQCHYNSAQYAEAPNCFIHFEIDVLTLIFRHSKIRVTSYQDSAGVEGAFLFGGLLDRCQMVPHELKVQGIPTMYQLLTDTKAHIFTATTRNNRTREIASQAYSLCFCDGPNHSRDCTGSRSVVIHRGQKFTVPLLAIAQGNVVISTSVTAITSPTAGLKLSQNTQYLPRHCSNLAYSLYSTTENEEVVLYPEGPCHDTGYARATLNITSQTVLYSYLMDSVHVTRGYMNITSVALLMKTFTSQGKLIQSFGWVPSI